MWRVDHGYGSAGAGESVERAEVDGAADGGGQGGGFAERRHARAARPQDGDHGRGPGAVRDLPGAVAGGAAPGGRSGGGAGRADRRPGLAAAAGRLPPGGGLRHAAGPREHPLRQAVPGAPVLRGGGRPRPARLGAGTHRDLGLPLCEGSGAAGPVRAPDRAGPLQNPRRVGEGPPAPLRRTTRSAAARAGAAARAAGRGAIVRNKANLPVRRHGVLRGFGSRRRRVDGADGWA